MYPSFTNILVKQVLIEVLCISWTQQNEFVNSIFDKIQVT